MKRFLTVAGPLLATGLIGLIGCAHHRDVRPGDDGVNRVVLSSDNKEGLYRDAMSEAEDFCKDSKRSPVIVSENSKYTGDMDESDYNTGKKLSRAAETAGGIVGVMGAPRESNAGNVVGLGGGVADQYLGKGYTYELRFRCR